MSLADYKKSPPFKVTGLDGISKNMVGKSIVLTCEIWDKDGEGCQAEVHIDDLTPQKVVNAFSEVFRKMHLMNMNPDNIEEVIVKSVKIKEV